MKGQQVEHMCNGKGFIAALFLTTEAVIADKPEKAPAMPAGDGGMGGMDF